MTHHQKTTKLREETFTTPADHLRQLLLHLMTGPSSTQLLLPGASRWEKCMDFFGPLSCNWTTVLDDIVLQLYLGT